MYSHTDRRNAPIAIVRAKQGCCRGIVAAVSAGLQVAALLTAALSCGAARAQEAVVAATDPDALFHSPNKKLDANKQVVYHIMKDLLEANHWNEADKWLTEAYHQHNPMIPSGRATVVGFFSSVAKPSPVPEHMKTKVAFVSAEGDLVTVATVRELPDPQDPAMKYTTTWYDTWRIRGGKADEHWDGATKAPRKN